jgi:predicted secreted Zn-dependent protease
MIHPIAFTSTLAVTTYNVTGKTENDISKSLEANAIADPHEPGSRYYALTKWQLGGNWVVKSSPRGCQVEEGSVSIFITMTLPALATTADVPANVLKKFDSFLDKTILHESDHAGLALQGARDYQRALGNFAPVSDCEGLKAQLNNLFRRSFESIDNVNTDYDIRTQHGRTQGAVFP